MPGCKPGDIAKVIHPGPDRGRLVHVDAAAQGRLHPERKAWSVTPLGAPLYAWNGSSYQWTEPGQRVVAYDSELEPLPGLPVDDTVLDEVTA